mmetsp:Transcript_41500/g.117531  ORF Transcript_41500/g.117531 Transcript_41500/m.117531 type:complete len:276 (+) Transcript_41500:400-1227(+)
MLGKASPWPCACVHSRSGASTRSAMWRGGAAAATQGWAPPRRTSSLLRKRTRSTRNDACPGHVAKPMLLPLRTAAAPSLPNCFQSTASGLSEHLRKVGGSAPSWGSKLNSKCLRDTLPNRSRSGTNVSKSCCWHCRPIPTTKRPLWEHTLKPQARKCGGSAATSTPSACAHSKTTSAMGPPASTQVSAHLSLRAKPPLAKAALATGNFLTGGGTARPASGRSGAPANKVSKSSTQASSSELPAPLPSSSARWEATCAGRRRGPSPQEGPWPAGRS